MGSEMNRYWLTLAMGLFICWLLVFVVKHMCWGLIRSGIDWSSFRKLNVLPAPPWSLTQGKDTKEDQRQRVGQAEVKGYNLTAVSLIGWGQVKVRLADGHLESRPGFWSKSRVTLMLSRESFDGKSKCRCSTPALSGTNTSRDAAVKLISGAGDTTILWVTQCSLSGKLIKSASPQGPHVAKMATSSLSGPPAALPMTSLRSQHTNPISCQPRFWNDKTKAWSALAHCADNHREIRGTKQRGILHHPNAALPDSSKLRGTSWNCPLKYNKDTFISKVDCFSFPCLKYNPAIFG